MTDVQQLLDRYKQAHREDAGADPRPYLAEVSGSDRELLSGLIDAYLEAAPRRPLDPESLRTSAAGSLAEGVQRSLEGQSGMWPSLLPRLRARARLRRAELVSQLAARLGAQAQEEKVALYYHQMEQGLLPEEGVSETVLDALGQVVGWSGDALRRAGRLPRPGPAARRRRGGVRAHDHGPGGPARPRARAGGPARRAGAGRVGRGRPPVSRRLHVSLNRALRPLSHAPTARALPPCPARRQPPARGRSHARAARRPSPERTGRSRAAIRAPRAGTLVRRRRARGRRRGAPPAPGWLSTPYDRGGHGV